MTPKPPEPSASHAYGIFCGQINQDSAKRIMEHVVIAIKNDRTHLHILLQSLGGFIGPAISLYNFLRSAPVHTTFYNIGALESAAVIVYLGATKRLTSARATFVIHRSRNSPESATAIQLEYIAQTLRVDDQRTESILRDHITLSDKEWASLN